MRAVKYLLIIFIFVVAACKKNADSVTINDTGLNPPGVTPNSFLAFDKYDKLIVEVQYVAGFEPSQDAIHNLSTFLQTYLNKPGGIGIVQKVVPSPGKSTYTLADIKDFESHNRTQLTRDKDKVLAAYILFVDGDYADTAGSSSKVLGVTYRVGSMVIFEKTIKSFSGGLSQPPTAALETVVTQHEFGHVMGLVNNGTAMLNAHQDTVNGRHCNNKDCLMYYQAETNDVLASLIGGTLPSLDANCVNDLRANGGK